jgi:hypothetical protein
MVRVSMHGVRIAYSADALRSDPLGTFFDRFSRIDNASKPDLTIELVPTSDAPSAVEKGELMPFFFHGRVQVYRGPTCVVVSNGSTRAEIANPSTIRAEVPASGADPDDVARVLHVALLWALRARALFDLHAAAVVPPGATRPIVIAGDSGSGKTTLTLAFLEAGFRYLGDDRVLLRCDAGSPTEVLSYPRVFHVAAATARAFPRLAARPEEATASVDGKQAVDPALAYASSFHAEAASPSLLIFPRVVDDATTLMRPLSQSDAFGHLLVSSAILAVEGMPYRDENLACLKDLASAVPAFELLSGADLLANPIRVVRDLEQLQPVWGGP